MVLSYLVVFWKRMKYLKDKLIKNVHWFCKILFIWIKKGVEKAIVLIKKVLDKQNIKEKLRMGRYESWFDGSMTWDGFKNRIVLNE